MSRVLFKLRTRHHPSRDIFYHPTYTTYPYVDGSSIPLDPNCLTFGTLFGGLNGFKLRKTFNYKVIDLIKKYNVYIKFVYTRVRVQKLRIFVYKLIFKLHKWET